MCYEATCYNVRPRVTMCGHVLRRAAAHFSAIFAAFFSKTAAYFPNQPRYHIDDLFIDNRTYKGRFARSSFEQIFTLTLETAKVDLLLAI